MVPICGKIEWAIQEIIYTPKKDMEFPPPKKNTKSSGLLGIEKKK